MIGRARRGGDSVALRAASVDLLLSALTDPIDAVQNQATRHLRRLCVTSSDAAELLAKVLRDGAERVRWRAVEALGLLVSSGPETLPLFFTALEDRDPRVATWGKKELRGIGPTPEVLSGLLTRIPGGTRRVRCRAAEALGELGSASEAVVGTLAGALADSDGAVRAAAAEALGEIGPAARDTIPALLVTLTDANTHVRLCVDRTAGRMARLTPEYQQLVLERTNPFVRGPFDSPLPVEILKLVRERSDEARAGAIAVLAVLKLRAAGAANALMAMLRHRGGPAAAGTPPEPGELENKSGPAVAPDAWILVFATMWQALGPDASSAVPHLEALGEHTNAFVRRVVAETLAAIRTPLTPTDPCGQDPAG